MARKDVTAVINIGRKAMREKEEIADVPMEGLPNPLMLENQLWKFKKKKKIQFPRSHHQVLIQLCWQRGWATVFT